MSDKGPTSFYNSGIAEDYASPDGVAPIRVGEYLVEDVLNRPGEAVRLRTEVLREELRRLMYWRDFGTRLVVERAVDSSLSVNAGVITQQGAFTLRPLLTPRTSIQGSLTIGTTGSNAVIYSVASDAYVALYPTNRIYVAHIDGGAGSALSVDINTGGYTSITTTFDASNTAHDASTVAAAVASALATSSLAGAVDVNTDAVINTPVIPQSLVLLTGTVDNLAYHFPTGTLTGIALSEGDALYVDWETLEGVGGRFDHVVERSVTVLASDLVVSAINSAPVGALALAKFIGGTLHWFTGEKGYDGVTAPVMAPHAVLVDPALLPSMPNVTNVQESLESVDTSLAGLRTHTYTVTDGVTSTGGDFNGASALDDAIVATQASGATLYVRPGNYLLSVHYDYGGGITASIISSSQRVIGESESSVTISTPATFLTINGAVTNVTLAPSTVTLGSGSRLHNVTALNNVQANSSGIAVQNLRVLGTSPGALYVYGGVRSTFSNVYVATSLHVENADTCTFRTLTIGGIGLDAEPSLMVSGICCSFTGLTLSTRAVSTTELWAIVDVYGAKHTFSGVHIDQTGVIPTSNVVGFRLDSVSNVQIKASYLHFKYASAVRMIATGGAPCTGVSIANCSIVASPVYAPVIDMASLDLNDHVVSFEDCLVDTNESGNFGIVAAPNGRAYRMYWDTCELIGVYRTAGAAEFRGSVFKNCVFGIKNPLVGGNRLLGGLKTGVGVPAWQFKATDSSTLTNNGCSLDACIFDMYDSEVENNTSPTTPVVSVSYVFSITDTRASNIAVININKHVNTTGAAGLSKLGLGAVGESSSITEFTAKFTSTATTQVVATTILHALLEITGDNTQVSDVTVDYRVGGAQENGFPDAAVLSMPTSKRRASIRDIRVFEGTGQLIVAAVATSILHDSSIEDCVLGASSGGSTTGVRLVRLQNVILKNCHWYISTVGSLISLSGSGGTSTGVTLEGCVVINRVPAASSFAAIDLNGDPLIRAVINGCRFDTSCAGIDTGVRSLFSGTPTDSAGMANYFINTAGSIAGDGLTKVSDNKW